MHIRTSFSIIDRWNSSVYDCPNKKSNVNIIRILLNQIHTPFLLDGSKVVSLVHGQLLRRRAQLI